MTDMTSTEPILVDTIDGVPVVTINRPDARNALDPRTSAEIGRVLSEFVDDDAVGAVVLTGAGDKAFCAGMDLKAFALGQQLDFAGPGAEVVLRDRYPKPLIAAVNGAAVGGGLDLMLGCDIVVAAEHATFALPEVKRGIASVGGSTRLAQRLPLGIALELGLVGERIDAERARGLGLVNRVVPAAEVLRTAVEIAAAIAANVPLAVEFTKTLMHDVAGSYDAARWRQVQATAAAIRQSADAREGARAFAEKRRPRWTGR